MPSKFNIKNYIREVRIEHDKRIAVSLGGGGGNYVDFTGATSISGGLSGLVPAPSIGDNKHFLRGDGTWTRPDTGNVVLDTVASGIEGALWKGLVNDEPVLKLRHGDYEYNFQYDTLRYINEASSVVETVEPDTYILGTASVSSEGGIWYDVNAVDQPTIWFHSGSFNYGINYDTLLYRGNNINLVSYLPFDSSATQDLCGKTWTANGNASISAEQYKFNNASVHLPRGAYLQSDNTFDLDDNRWTFDTWFYATATNSCLFGLGVSGGQTGIGLYSDGLWFGRLIGGNTWAASNGDYRNPTNTWTHFAVVKDGSNYYLFENGVLVFNTTVASIVQDNTISLGGNAYDGYNANVYFDRTRFCQGVALWTADFTPPTASDYL